MKMLPLIENTSVVWAWVFFLFGVRDDDNAAGPGESSCGLHHRPQYGDCIPNLPQKGSASTQLPETLARCWDCQKAVLIFSYLPWDLSRGPSAACGCSSLPVGGRVAGRPCVGGGLGSAGLAAGRGGVTGLFQPKWFHDSTISGSTWFCVAFEAEENNFSLLPLSVLWEREANHCLGCGAYRNPELWIKTFPCIYHSIFTSWNSRTDSRTELR